MTSKKEVSIGEFDERTGLTHITLQRGRLMFNMGPPSTKRAAAAAAAAAATTVAETPSDSVPPHDKYKPSDGVVAEQDSADAPHPSRLPLLLPPQQQQQRVYRSGVFTGRSLFAEEAVYLVQRSALVVYAMEELVEDGHEDAMAGHEPPRREPLVLAQLIARAMRYGFATLATLDVYAFLKDNKLHPRRSVGVTKQPPHEQEEDTGALMRMDATPLFLFDVFKTITETQYVPDIPPPTEKENASLEEEQHENATEATPRKRKVKRLALIFRVAVSTFRDASPRPRELRRLLSEVATRQQEEQVEYGGGNGDGGGGGDHRVIVPLKLAVAGADRSVLLFEVA